MQNGGDIQPHHLKEQLVPNFTLLDHEVQIQIVNVLETITLRVDKPTIQRISRMGVLEEAPLLRSHIWKLLLQTLSLDPKTWKAAKQANRQLYHSLVDKFIGKYIDDEDLLGLYDKNFDKLLWQEIELDTRRTHSVLNFFQKEIQHSQISLVRKSKNSDILSRILYIWAKMNPTVRYVQGMNEILAPLYYLQFQRFTEEAESEVFFMFASIMTFALDMHVKDLDNTEEGIMGRMKTLNKYLKVIDYELWDKLDSEKIIPHYYSFRWLTLMLAQEFGLCQTMKLWDILFSFDGYKRYFYLYSLCIAILKMRKDLIMSNDFIQILPRIQKLRDLDVGCLVYTANKVYEKYSRVNLDKIYRKMNEELQIRSKKDIKEEKKEDVEKISRKSWSYEHIMNQTTSLLSKLTWSKTNK